MQKLLTAETLGRRGPQNTAESLRFHADRSTYFFTLRFGLAANSVFDSGQTCLPDGPSLSLPTGTPRLPLRVGRQSACKAGSTFYPKEKTMNSVIYIVGLIVVVGAILSYFGFR